MDRQRARDADGQPVRPSRKGIPGTERVLCLDTKDGRLIWQDEYDCPYKVSYPSGPRTTPLVHEGRVYTLGAMGDLRVLDAATGKIIWNKNVAQEFKVEAPVWGYAAHPLIDGDLLY
jgi:outer membrane protein assembly factor BamB